MEDHNNLIIKIEADKLPSYLECIGQFNEDKRIRDLICHYEYTTGYRFIQHEFRRIIHRLIEWNRLHSNPPTREEFQKIVEKCCH